MITVISGSNRKNSECLGFSKRIASGISRHTDTELRLLALEQISHGWFFPEMYDKGGQHPDLIDIQELYILPAEKFIFVFPEYNGTFPGSLKLFIDAVSARLYKDNFKNKKVGMVGISSGRAGNIRGMDQLTTVMHHLGALVMPNQLPISRIHDLMNEAGEVTDQATLEVMDKFIREFVAF